MCTYLWINCFILFNYMLYRWWNRFEGFVILLLNNVINFVKTCTLSFQIDIWYIMTMMGNCVMNFMDWGKQLRYIKKKSAVFHQQCELWKAENVKTGLYIQLPKMMLMDSGVVCDGTLLHWGNLLKVYTHSKTCKPRMSGILFRLETVNLRYVLSLC